MTRPSAFRALIAAITGDIRGRPVDGALEADLNARFPPASPAFRGIAEACREAVAAGWMCDREAGGIKYGRVIKAGPDTHGFSVDVVEMDDASRGLTIAIRTARST